MTSSLFVSGWRGGRVAMPRTGFCGCSERDRTTDFQRGIRNFPSLIGLVLMCSFLIRTWSLPSTPFDTGHSFSLIRFPAHFSLITCASLSLIHDPTVFKHWPTELDRRTCRLVTTLDCCWADSQPLSRVVIEKTNEQRASSFQVQPCFPLLVDSCQSRTGRPKGNSSIHPEGPAV